MLLTRLWLGLSVYSTWTSKYCQKFAYTYIYIYTYIWKGCMCASICIHRVNFFVTNPRRKANIAVSFMCKAAYFILVPILIYSFNPTLKRKNWGCYTSFQKWVFQSQISQKGAHACQFWLVPAGDEMWTSQYIEKILHCVLVCTHPKNPHPHCICLGKGQAFRTRSRILKYLYSFQIQCWPCTNSAFKTGQLKDIF